MPDQVSIVIPTKNAGPGFRDTLEAIAAQSVLPGEVVVVDSGSSDGTLELAGQFGARTVSVAPESFNHGETRNFGLRQASGEVCILLVQDAVPAGPNWLEGLIAPFSDPRVAGVTGRQVPRPDADPLARWEVDYRNRFLGDQFLVRQVDPWEKFRTLSFEERLRTASFDNVCSALRRSVWERQPFRALVFAEDLDWGVRALEAGYRLAYNPSAAVVHSHSRPALYNLRRQYVSGKTVPQFLQMPPADPGVHDDAEFFSLVGFLCGEVEAMLGEQPGDWAQIQDFSRRATGNGSLWRSLRSASGLSRPPASRKRNPMREHFYFLLDQLSGGERPPALEGSLLVQALARSIGVFAASYHVWRQSHGGLTAEMRRLDAALSREV